MKMRYTHICARCVVADAFPNTTQRQASKQSFILSYFITFIPLASQSVSHSHEIHACIDWCLLYNALCTLHATSACICSHKIRENWLEVPTIHQQHESKLNVENSCSTQAPVTLIWRHDDGVLIRVRREQTNKREKVITTTTTSATEAIDFECM